MEGWDSHVDLVFVCFGIVYEYVSVFIRDMYWKEETKRVY